MNTFMDSLKQTLGEDFNVSRTANGAIGYSTTGKELLDINFAVSSLRNESPESIKRRFAKAFFEDKLLAIKWMFFAGDVRGGLGERRLFRICMEYLIQEERYTAWKLLKLIPEYTRWDNLVVLLDTALSEDAAKIIKDQLNDDMFNYERKQPISLCAKWLPSVNTSSAETRRHAKLLIGHLGMTERQYRKMISALRSYSNVVEVKMSKRKWSAIDYASVPSRANLIYNNAFLRNDEQRRREYLAKLEKGETKINAGVLFPHDIVHKYTEGSWRCTLNPKDTVLEEMWKALPDYVKGSGNTICVADGSGSMTSRIGGTNVSCLDVANALSIYFAERSSGQFKDKYITFSEHPQLVNLANAKSLRDKIGIALTHNEVATTNIEAVFDLILKTAVNAHMKQSELPANILILSDMEFNDATRAYERWDRGYAAPNDKLFAIMQQRYAEYGYKLPRLVFWNICSSTNTIPVKENELGVALVSGFSPAIVQMVLRNSVDPYECLLEQLNSERYTPVEEAVKN